jgi:hypothetical protein
MDKDDLKTVTEGVPGLTKPLRPQPGQGFNAQEIARLNAKLDCARLLVQAWRAETMLRSQNHCADELEALLDGEPWTPESFARAVVDKP